MSLTSTFLGHHNLAQKIEMFPWDIFGRPRQISDPRQNDMWKKRKIQFYEQDLDLDWIKVEAKILIQKEDMTKISMLFGA